MVKFAWAGSVTNKSLGDALHQNDFILSHAKRVKLRKLKLKDSSLLGQSSSKTMRRPVNPNLSPHSAATPKNLRLGNLNGL